MSWDVQIGFLQQLMTEGSGNSTDVVFLDMDILVIDSLAEVPLSPAPLYHLSHYIGCFPMPFMSILQADSPCCGIP